MVEDDLAAVAAGVLVRAMSPTRLVSSRDANAKGYRRFLSAPGSALDNVARTRSAYFDSALKDSARLIQK